MGATQVLRTRIPEAVFTPVVESGQQMEPLTSSIVVRYVADPEVIAANTFYHFKESPDSTSERDLTLKMSPDDRKQFIDVAEALHVTQRDLVSNALIRHFNLDMEKIPHTQAVPFLSHDPEEADRLSRVKAKPAPAVSEEPLVQSYTMGDMNRVIAETGDRSPHVTAGTKAEQEARRRVNFVIPEWKK
jgi:hypothetical protein